MKAFIIHTSHEKSLEYANKALASFELYQNWQPELFKGVEPITLSLFEEKYPLQIKQQSRAEIFFNVDKKRYTTKKCCSYNHYRLFQLCIELDQPIAVIEHDSHCVADWTNIDFEEILLMNIVSAIRQHPTLEVRIKNENIDWGLQDLCLQEMNYRHDPTWNNAIIIPGTAAYAVTPQGAQKMINVYESVGWEQSDFIINTHNVRIQTIVPELFTFKLPNLKTSHGDLVL